MVEVEGREVGGESGTTKERRGERGTAREETTGRGGAEAIEAIRWRRWGWLFIKGRG